MVNNIAMPPKAKTTGIPVTSPKMREANRMIVRVVILTITLYPE